MPGAGEGGEGQPIILTGNDFAEKTRTAKDFPQNTQLNHFPIRAVFTNLSLDTKSLWDVSGMHTSRAEGRFDDTARVISKRRVLFLSLMPSSW